jgi:hypothetical protein
MVETTERYSDRIPPGVSNKQQEKDGKGTKYKWSQTAMDPSLLTNSSLKNQPMEQLQQNQRTQLQQNSKISNIRIQRSTVITRTGKSEEREGQEKYSLHTAHREAKKNGMKVYG